MRFFVDVGSLSTALAAVAVLPDALMVQDVAGAGTLGSIQDCFTLRSSC